ncbi:MAG: hypothetical protein H7328_09830 [Bdellovibrio sp.]|nr:hypothetical protein [Bdellovibrio sp.]
MKQESNSPCLGLKSIRNERGQSVVEYLLILVVTVSLVLLSKKMFTPLSQFMDRYMGDYIVCLMEYGELPSLGVENESLKSHKGGAGGGRTCDAKFENFNLGDGVQAKTGGSSKGAGSDTKNSTSNAGKNGTNSDSDSKASAAEKAAAARSGRSGGRQSSSGNLAGNPVSRADSGFGTADGASLVTSSKVRVLKDGEGEDGAEKRAGGRNERNSSRVSYARPAYRGVSGRMNEEIEKSIRKPAQTLTSKVFSKSDEGYRFKTYKKTFTPPAPKTTVADSEEEGFSFGYMFKWLIIAGIVILIFILFGGQIMNYSNSKDQ